MLLALNCRVYLLLNYIADVDTPDFSHVHTCASEHNHDQTKPSLVIDAGMPTMNASNRVQCTATCVLEHRGAGINFSAPIHAESEELASLPHIPATAKAARWKRKCTIWQGSAQQAVVRILL